jgi:putative membrane protein
MIGGAINTELIVIISVALVSLLALFIYFVIRRRSFNTMSDPVTKS